MGTWTCTREKKDFQEGCISGNNLPVVGFPKVFFHFFDFSIRKKIISAYMNCMCPTGQVKVFRLFYKLILNIDILIDSLGKLTKKRQK